MKHKFVVSLAALLSAIMIIPAGVRAIGFEMDGRDRPFYHGPSYWAGGTEWVWVPGHFSKRRQKWVHGFYVRRAVWHRDWDYDRYERFEHDEHHENEHHESEHHDHDHH